jgi:hypothetical protein
MKLTALASNYTANVGFSAEERAEPSPRSGGHCARAVTEWRRE